MAADDRRRRRVLPNGAPFLPLLKAERRPVPATLGSPQGRGHDPPVATARSRKVNKITRQRVILLAVGLVSLVLVVFALRSPDDRGGLAAEGTGKGGTPAATTPPSSPGGGSTRTSALNPGPEETTLTGGPGGGSTAATNGVIGGPVTPGAPPTPGTNPPSGAVTTIQPGPGGTVAPTVPVPPPGTGAIGYVGCSLTRGAVDGYHELGGTRFWPPAQDYSGGTVERWAENLTSSSPYWATFDALNRANPSTVIWWELCAHTQPSDAANYSYALSVLGEIGRRIPGVTVYVSAENGWGAPHVCDVMGVDGPARMRVLRDRLVGEARARLGPDLGDVPTSQIAPDGCHPDEEGRKLLGAKLVAFGF